MHVKESLFTPLPLHYRVLQKFFLEEAGVFFKTRTKGSGYETRGKMEAWGGKESG